MLHVILPLFYLLAWYADLQVLQECFVEAGRGLKVNFLLNCLSEECPFSFRMFERYVACGKWGQYLLWWLCWERFVYNLCSRSLLQMEFIDSGPATILSKERTVVKPMWHRYSKVWSWVTDSRYRSILESPGHDLWIETVLLSFSIENKMA